MRRPNNRFHDDIPLHELRDRFDHHDPQEESRRFSWRVLYACAAGMLAIILWSLLWRW